MSGNLEMDDDGDDDWLPTPSLSSASRARLLADYARYCGIVSAYVNEVVPVTADAPEPERDLARRMLDRMLQAVDPGDVISPGALADDIGESKRKKVREAGRLLQRLGLIIAITEPSATPEGETVLGYMVSSETQEALNDYYKAQATEAAPDAAAADPAAPKQ